MALIILADDDKNVRDFVALLLEKKGHRCMAYSNGDDALDALRTEPDTDLLVSDVAMPTGDGRDLLESLRNGPPRLRSMPVLLISGQVPEHLMTDIVEDALCCFLQKPFSAAQLYDVVDTFTTISGRT